MELPSELFVQAVPDSENVFAFNYAFDLEGKSLDDAVVTQLDDGDLLIEGWAAEFEGEDRQGENFVPGAFEKGVKGFLEHGSSPLCYQHKHRLCLGKVLELKDVPDRGLYMKARVDGAIKNHPEMGTYYEQIKKGTLNSLSVGGFFRRTNTPDGPRIAEVDLTEISVTPVPVHAKPAFSVIAGKALEGMTETSTGSAFDEGSVLAELSAALDGLAAALPEGKAAPEPKGDPDDLHVLALILALEQITNNLPDENNAPERDPDARVDALVEKTKTALDSVAKEAHALAAKLGPLPKVTWLHESY